MSTTLYLHTAHRVAKVDPRVFGGFLEHLGRAVYQGVYEPGSAHADEHGCRADVVGALRGLRLTAMRYPGGNFVSGYHWEDGVGPLAGRPRVRELAWQSIEPNRFGTDEFLGLCGRLGWTPMMAVNLGTGSPEEARNWVEYCNSPVGSRYADMRAANGREAPWGVKLWCLGNEMDGPWQIGHGPAEHYAIRAQQAAKLMRDTDPTLELVASGSSGPGMGSYMEWDRKVLEYVGDYADYLSIHRYAANNLDDTADYLAIGNAIDRQIEESDAVCRYVQARRKSRKRARLAFDEWNVWYRATSGDGKGKEAPHLLEEVYNLEDALVAAAFLHSFVRHADCVKIANLAQIVNVIAPILTRGDQMLLQSIYFPFEMFSRRRDGHSLRVVLDGPTYDTRQYGVATTIDASAILGDGVLHVFATNRDLERPHELTVDLAGASVSRPEGAQIVTGTDPKAANSFERPDAVAKQPFDGLRVHQGRATLELPPLSFAAATFRLA